MSQTPYCSTFPSLQYGFYSGLIETDKITFHVFRASKKREFTYATVHHANCRISLNPFGKKGGLRQLIPACAHSESEIFGTEFLVSWGETPSADFCLASKTVRNVNG